MAEVFTLNVNSQDLVNTAEAFRQSGSTVAGITEEMMSLVTGMTGVWSSATSEAYIRRFTGLEDDINRLAGMINEHVEDLETMARTYDDAEAFGVDATEVLQMDVII